MPATPRSSSVFPFSLPALVFAAAIALLASCAAAKPVVNHAVPGTGARALRTTELLLPPASPSVARESARQADEAGSGTIVFESEHDGRLELYRMDADGSR